MSSQSAGVPVTGQSFFRQPLQVARWVNTSVSNRPICLMEAAVCSVARPPTTCRMVGSAKSRSGPTLPIIHRENCRLPICATTIRLQRVLRITFCQNRDLLAKTQISTLLVIFKAGNSIEKNQQICAFRVVLEQTYVAKHRLLVFSGVCPTATTICCESRNTLLQDGIQMRPPAAPET